MSFSTEKHPGVCAQPDAASNGFCLNHCMLRVKDPQVALDFYTRIFGMRVLRKLDFPEMKFSLYFLHRATDGAARGEHAAACVYSFSPAERGHGRRAVRCTGACRPGARRARCRQPPRCRCRHATLGCGQRAAAPEPAALSPAWRRAVAGQRRRHAAGAAAPA